MCGGAGGAHVLTLFRDRYEVLATVGSGGEAQIVKALDRQHGRFVSPEDPPGTRSGRARGPARRGARAAGPAAASGAAARARGLLRSRRLRRRDGLGRGHRPGDAARRERAAGARRRRACWRYLAQAAEALTHLHSQSPPVIHGDVKPGNLHPDARAAGSSSSTSASRPRPDLPRVRAGTPGYRARSWPPAAAPSRASDVYALARDGVRAAHRLGPDRGPARWDGFDPDAGRAARGGDPARDGDGPGPPAEVSRRVGRAPASRLGRPRCRPAS